MPFVRSLVFYVVLFVMTLLLPLHMLISLPMPMLVRQRFLSRWPVFVITLLRVICGLDYRVRGAENIPPGPAIILSKHQSTWETFALQAIFPAQTWVLKRSLLLIPIFGWSLALAQAIAIDRGSPKEALNQVIHKGTDRLRKGLWVVIFPEGTRIPFGRKGKYNAGGAMLATRSGFPVVPVAHDAGRYWVPSRFAIRPGTVQVVVGPVLVPEGRRAGEITADVEQWIEGTMDELA
jgi:1-acyl-sn-glycerol-3-phosphate acyltransferase